MSAKENPDATMISSTSKTTVVGVISTTTPELTQDVCIAKGCNNAAVQHPEWDNEYCSVSCTYKHCKATFLDWLANNKYAKARASQAAAAAAATAAAAAAAAAAAIAAAPTTVAAAKAAAAATTAAAARTAAAIETATAAKTAAAAATAAAPAQVNSPIKPNEEQPTTT